LPKTIGELLDVEALAARDARHLGKCICSVQEGSGHLPSDQAKEFWDLLRATPKQIDLDLPHRWTAGEHAEDATTEPTATTFTPAPEVGGLWAQPRSQRAGAAILYIFGGGYVLGSPNSRRKTAGHLAEATGARALLPGYRLAPEHNFPASVEDIVSAYRFLLSRGAVPGKIAIVGDSSGGGLAIATLIALRASGLPLPGGAVAISPWADLTCSGDTMTSKAAVDIECTQRGLLEMAGWYLDKASPRSPTASPIFADLTGCPPFFCVVGSDEILLDDSVRLVRGGGIAGVDARLWIAAGMQHVFPIWKGAFPEADAAITAIASWISEQTR
jgi:monoterpene epsilon-lactone hydrolase